MRVCLEIGGFRIHLSEDQNIPVHHWPQWMFQPFEISAETTADLFFRVHVTETLPAVATGELVFDASQGLWKLTHTSDGFMLEVPKTTTKKPFLRAFLSPDFSSGDIHIKRTRVGGVLGWCPAKVMNPLVEACLLTRLAREGGIFLHASAVKVGGEVWVFCGPSGAGKSTLATFFKDRHFIPLSDERMILRILPEGLHAYGTPWHGDSRYVSSDRGRLTRFFLIRHGQGQHALRPISSLEFHQRFLSQCSLPLWDRLAMEQTSVLMGRILNETDCYDFAPLQEEGAVDFLLEHFSQKTLVPAEAT